MEITKGLKKLATLTGWRQLFKILTKKEKIIFSLFLFFFIASLTFLLIGFYFKNTEIQPTAGGTYSEGVLTSSLPRFINPVYANSDIDRDLTELIFSGLMKYNSDGKIVPDLTKNYQIVDEGKTWEIELRENLSWSDEKPLTADDVIFTIETIQNPEIKSPLRANWLGVEMERTSDRTIRFKLKNSSIVFLDYLTLKIIPKHIWENVSPQNFPLSLFNLRPIGSGHYKLKDLIQDNDDKITSLDLIKNPNYYEKTPNLQEISFQFFDKEEDLIKAAQEGKINGFSLTLGATSISLASYNIYNFSLPRYFAVFFNPEGSKALAEREVRQALNYGESNCFYFG